MIEPTLVEQFLAYCRDYQSYKPRERPANPRTISRYHRGLKLVEKIIGHSLETVSDTDQLIFIEGIMKYSQGTRRVSTQIFQRYIAWGRRNGHLDVENLIVGKEDMIIGEHTKPAYTYFKRSQIKRFFLKLKNPQLRACMGLVYYGGLTTSEIPTVRKQHITNSGLIVYRQVLQESQILSLPEYFMRELQEYAETRNDFLFDLPKDEFLSRQQLTLWYSSATLEADELIGSHLKDFRTSGIRHFYETSLDLELTKAFAGVPQNKKGWLDSLVDMSSYHMGRLNKLRSHHGTAEQMESS